MNTITYRFMVGGDMTNTLNMSRISMRTKQNCIAIGSAALVYAAHETTNSDGLNVWRRNMKRSWIVSTRAKRQGNINTFIQIGFE